MKYIIIVLLGCFLYSCMDDDKLEAGTMQLPLESINAHRGVFITNEGAFRWDNASLSYYDIDADTVYNDIFYGMNDLVLGDVAQSMTIRGDYGYIVVNNSSKIYVINIRTMKAVGKITGLTSPRYIHFLSDKKAYVTDLYAKAITIINPSTLEITGQINVNNHTSEFYQHPTEQMIQYKQYVFTNCWSYDNKLLVIDTNTDQVVDSIEVIKQPTSIVLDKHNRIWVASDGGYWNSPYGQVKPGITCVDAETRKVLKKYEYPIDSGCSKLCINSTRDTIYFLNKDCYRMAVDTDLEPQVFVKTSDLCEATSWGFYSVTVDPVTSEVYLVNAKSFSVRGDIYRVNSKGELISTFECGITPGSFCFK